MAWNDEAKRYVSAVASARRAADWLAGRPVWRAPSLWVSHRLAQRRVAELADMVTVEHWDTLAAWVISGTVRDLFEEEQIAANPFGKATLERVDELSALFVADPPPRRVSEATAYTDLASVPELAERLAPEAVRAFITGEVTRRARVAADPRILHAFVELDGRPGLVVQHQASGLRAHLGYAENPGFVFSKPYSIRSIDPDLPDEPDNQAEIGSWWQQYVGLGIGRRLYEHGAAMLPEYRWRSTAGPDAARALRRRLHAADPWRWHSAECSCHPVWTDLTPATAASTQHQLTAGPSIGG